MIKNHDQRIRKIKDMCPSLKLCKMNYAVTCHIKRRSYITWGSTSFFHFIIVESNIRSSIIII